MIIESWIFVMIFLFFAGICVISLAGWIYEGEKLRKQVEENKTLREKNKMLEKRIAYRNALDNIKVANEFYEESKKND